MIADGPRACFQCSTVFVFSAGFPVEVRWSASPCLGCERWHEYLELSRKAAEKRQREAEQPEEVDLSDVAAIEARLRQGRPVAQPEPDWQRAEDYKLAQSGDTE